MKSATTAESNPSVMVLESSIKVSDSSYKIDDSRRVGDTRFIKNSYVWYQFIERLSTLITLELIFRHLSLTRKLLLLTILPKANLSPVAFLHHRKHILFR
jgi:hypothetical protein